MRARVFPWEPGRPRARWSARRPICLRNRCGARPSTHGPTSSASERFVFEMLAGRAAFTRESPADTMAAILKEDSPALAPAVAPALERIVLRCLEKSRESRFQSARDLAFALEGLSGTTKTAPIAERSGAPWLLQPALAWALAGALALLLILLLWAPWRSVPTTSPIVLSVQPGGNVTLAESISSVFGHTMTISARGDVIAFQAQKSAGGTRQLHVLRLDQLDAVALPGTDDAVAPFFSPDGLWIGFFADGQLKRVATTGGAPQALAPAPDPRGGAWGEDEDRILARQNIGDAFAACIASRREGGTAGSARGGRSHPGLAADSAWWKRRALYGQRRPRCL